jgi:hypothetical protein
MVGAFCAFGDCFAIDPTWTGILCPSHFQLVEVAVVTTKPGNNLVTFEQLKISWRLHERDDK